MNRVFVVMPVYGRLPLLKHTISRLYDKNGIDHVICVGWTQAEKEVCEDAGAEFILHENILGAKLNIGFEAACIEGATHILFVGSSDFVSDNYLDIMLPLVPENGFVGTKGCYMAHIEQAGNYYCGLWHGYADNRSFEPIGIGRIISRKALELCSYRPFVNTARSGVDWQMYQTVIKNRGKVIMYDGEDAYNMCISTDAWFNLHKYGPAGGSFSQLENPKLWLRKNFPETLKIFNKNGYTYKFKTNDDGM